MNEKKKYIGLNTLAYYNSLIKLALNGKVDKIEGKGLSTNDLTDELKEKILNAGDSSFAGDYNDLTNKPNIPTNNNQLVNGAGYQTSAEVQSLINNSLAGITGIDFQIVEALPGQGVKGTIYLISNSGSNPNIYDEYIYVNNSFEKIGSTDIDLSDYVKKTDLVEVTNAEIDEIVGA